MHNSSSGQILVLVLLVVLVGMTVGLSVASRTLTTLRNQAELTESNRAFSAAEAGIEQALLQLKQGNDCSGNSCAPSIDNVQTNVSVIDVGGSSNPGRSYGVSSLNKDEVFQLNLDSFSGASVNVYWGNNGDNGNCASSAALVSTLVYINASGEYGVQKATFDACKSDSANPSRAANNFDTDVAINPSISLTLQDGTLVSDYGYGRTIHMPTTSGVRPISLRVRLMYAGPKPVAFMPVSGSNLPFQGKQITSTSVVGGQQRTVKVLRSNDTLPAIFDYALFNGSTNSLTK